MQNYCGHCGGKLDEGAKVCGYCGTPIAQEKESHKSRAGIKRTFLFLTLVIVLGISILFFLDWRGIDTIFSLTQLFRPTPTKNSELYNSSQEKDHEENAAPQEEAPQLAKPSVTPEKTAVEYLGRDITAYNSGLYYEEYSGSSPFSLGGVAYRHGFTIGTYESGGYASFNLGGNYKYLSGVAGNVDGVNYSLTYNVLGDGDLIGTIEVKGGACQQNLNLRSTECGSYPLSRPGKRIMRKALVLAI